MNHPTSNNINSETESQSVSSIRLSIASPEKIRSWSSGEVTEPAAFVFKNSKEKAEKNGIHCEKIFGPLNDYQCACSNSDLSRIDLRKKPKERKTKQYIRCKKCGVMPTRSVIRRERMGHIELAVPVVHPWYIHSISMLLNVKVADLQNVVKHQGYLILDPKETQLRKCQFLSEAKFQEKFQKYYDGFSVGQGPEIIHDLLCDIQLEKEAASLREDAMNTKSQTELQRINKRLKLITSFVHSGNKPEWMVLKVLPVLPSGLRPFTTIYSESNSATAKWFNVDDGLNELYRSVILRNKQIREYIQSGYTPNIIIQDSKLALYKAVNELFDSSKLNNNPASSKVTHLVHRDKQGKTRLSGSVRKKNKKLRSIVERIKGKQGRFRQNLLGKRVDYSGRSVIVCGPYLKLHQCGLPKKMALELFKPFICNRLIASGLASTIKAANKMVETEIPEVWDILEEVVQQHPILLNRQPTLHRLGIQAFEPLLIEDKAIHLHPLVCKAFGADFDGDQMAVHVPISEEAQLEARVLMLSSNNITNSSNGELIEPSQDALLGLYYMTLEVVSQKGEGAIFANAGEALNAYKQDVISLHAQIKLRVQDYEKTDNGFEPSSKRIVETTVGRAIFSRIMPEGLNFDLINEALTKKVVSNLIHVCYRTQELKQVVIFADQMMHMGFEYSTKSGISICMNDMITPNKGALLKHAENETLRIQKDKKISSNEENLEKIECLWIELSEQISQLAIKMITPKKRTNIKGSHQKKSLLNSVHMMADSGARSSPEQIGKLSGMHGLIQLHDGSSHRRTCLYGIGYVHESLALQVIKNSLKQGLNPVEYLVSSSGARTTLFATAKTTAKWGYLARRLVATAHDLVITEEDCRTENGLIKKAVIDSGNIAQTLGKAVLGRITAQDVTYPNTTSLFLAKGHLINKSDSDKVDRLGIKSIKVRSVVTCETTNGVCGSCYGSDMVRGHKVCVGEAIGVIAAQSIGEPGTQLNLHKKRSGGVADKQRDRATSFDKVDAIFEARESKEFAIIAKATGVVSLVDLYHKGKSHYKLRLDITNQHGKIKDTKRVLRHLKLNVVDGDVIKKGDVIYEGPQNPHDILRTLGAEATTNHILREVQSVYRPQGAIIADKHVETIIKQMLKRVNIIDCGDADYVNGETAEYSLVIEKNKELKARGKATIKYERLLTGISKATLLTESPFSAAAFQKTSHTLTEASISGKIDHIRSFATSNMVGSLIPAGSAFKARSTRETQLNQTHNWLSLIVRSRKNSLINRQFTHPVNSDLVDINISKNLLTAEEEVRLAKEIEVGTSTIMQAITLLPFFIEVFMKKSNNGASMKNIVAGSIGELDELGKITGKKYNAVDEKSLAQCFNKIQIEYKTYSNLNSAYGYRDCKTIKARNNVSTSLSRLRLKPKILEEILTLLAKYIAEVIKQELAISKTLNYAGVDKSVFSTSFRGNETNFEWLKTIKVDEGVKIAYPSCQEEIYSAQQSLLEIQEEIQITISELSKINKNKNIGTQKANKAKTRMIESNVRLVYDLIGKNFRTTNKELRNQYFNDGIKGLTNSVNTFNYRFGTKFSTIATKRINGEIIRGINNNARAIRIPENIYLQKIVPLLKAKEEILNTTGQKATDKQLSENTGISIQEVGRLLSLLKQPKYMEEKINGESEVQSFEDLIQDKVQTPDIAYENLDGLISTAFHEANLTEIEAQALVLRFKEGLNLDDIAITLKISNRNRISPLLNKARKKVVRILNKSETVADILGIRSDISTKRNRKHIENAKRKRTLKK